MKASGIGTGGDLMRHDAALAPTAPANQLGVQPARPGLIGGAVVRAARRNAGLTRRTLALVLVVTPATVRHWELGTLPLFAVDYCTLRRLAAATGADLRKLLIAGHCDLLIASMLSGEEDFADVPPIDEDNADGCTARNLLSWAFNNGSLFSRNDVQRIASLACDLAAGTRGPALAVYGTVLLQCLSAQPQFRTRRCPMADERDRLDAVMAQIAQDTGAELYVWPRPGRAVERIVLRDTRDHGGAQLEIAQIEDDGTIRALGHDTGPEVTEFFGVGITAYDWQFVVAPERVGNLLTALGGCQGDDVLAALNAYYDQHGARIHELLTSAEVDAKFSNWHS